MIQFLNKSNALKPADITELAEYQNCLVLSNSILGADSPRDYRTLSYIESAGSQYIDTECVPTKNTTIEIEFKKTGNNIDYERLLGVKDYYEVMRDSSNASSDIWIFKINRNLSSTGNQVNIGAFGKDKNTLKITPDTVYFNGNIIGNFNQQVPNTSKSIYLFFSNNGDRYGNFQLFKCKIYEGDILIRNFIPVELINNIYGLYDLANYKYYYNKGKGVFYGGEE